MLSGAWTRAKLKEGARLCAGLGSAPRIQQGKRDGWAVSGSFVPQPVQQGSWSLGLGVFLLLGLLCCSPAAHVLLCPAAMAVLLCCHPSPAAVAPAGAACCSHAPCMAVVDGTWGAKQDPPVPAALARAGTLALLSYRLCTQPLARAKELHMGPGLSASSPSHQLLGARMVAVKTSSEQCHPLPAAHPQV